MVSQDNTPVLVIDLSRELPSLLDGAAIHRVQSKLEMAEDNPSVLAIVLVGSEKNFLESGEDSSARTTREVDDLFRQLTQAVETCVKPVVAATRGKVKNRGLELALACHGRVTDAAAQFGFDDINWGLIPGAGGTQRLLRLIGIDAAYDLIQSGRMRTADQLKQSGLFDFTLEDNVEEEAERLARDLAVKLAAGKSLPRIRDIAIDSKEVLLAIEEKRSKLNSRQKSQSVYTALMQALQKSSDPFDVGLRHEHELFNVLKEGFQARALCHQFTAEKEAVQMPGNFRSSPMEIETVAVIGAGTMGTGIAIASLDAGYQVILVEQANDVLIRGRERIHVYYDERVLARKLDAAKAISAKQRLSTTIDWQLIAGADLVIEAVFEDMLVKKDVFSRLDAVAKPGAILATNTSYLDLDAIANVTNRPQDVIGLHFFSPANVMKLLEVVRGAATSPQVLATGMAFGRKLKKVPVLCGNAFGFIGNRIYNAYRKQCEFMLEDGAWPEEIDSAVTDLGFAMGPFSVADLSGLDIAWRMRKSQAVMRDPRERYVSILDRLCEQGRLGQKTGMGYYIYQDGKRSKETDSSVRTIIENARAERGIAPRRLEASLIQRRVLLAMVNEAALLLAEGVAARASDIDVVLVQGYGFPRWLGGPVFWARQQERAVLNAELEEMVKESGFGAIQATPAMLDALIAV